MFELDEEFKKELNELKDNWTFEKAVEIDNEIAGILETSPVGHEIEYLEKFMKLTAKAALSHSVMIDKWKERNASDEARRKLMGQLVDVVDKD